MGYKALKRYASCSKRDFYGVRIYGLRDLKPAKAGYNRVYEVAGEHLYSSVDEAIRRALDMGEDTIYVRDVPRTKKIDFSSRSFGRATGKIKLTTPPCEAARVVRGSFDEVLENVKASYGLSDDRDAFSHRGFDALCDDIKRFFYDNLFVGFNRTRDLDDNFDAYKIYIEGRADKVMRDSRWRDRLFDCLVSNEISALMMERFKEARVSA